MYHLRPKIQFDVISWDVNQIKQRREVWEKHLPNKVGFALAGPGAGI